ncbi:DUF2922 domain-containing protein [Microaerobacter geothermalis]|uniref:DUF2922 domain-containing protein n=1 Tax=Microaerobacter geothermalis TaxID=674972 RepID=UPI001F42B732|nr:DUF2922 domain-containing protein [Microaerobacter geothermalis]MCF6095307.1 DUF2922 domain-containing protein [Microaerobacter geothermalis]
MAKTLDLLFLNQEGKRVRLSINNPTEPVDPLAVSTVMDLVIAKNIFSSTGGDLISKEGAELTERTVTEIVLG